jgi:hypothetical protein
VKSKPFVGQRVKLSREGWRGGLVTSEEDAKCAAETKITWVSDSDYIDSEDFWAVEVEGSLNRYMLHSDHFEELP